MKKNNVTQIIFGAGILILTTSVFADFRTPVSLYVQNTNAILSDPISVSFVISKGTSDFNIFDWGTVNSNTISGVGPSAFATTKVQPAFYMTKYINSKPPIQSKINVQFTATIAGHPPLTVTVPVSIENKDLQLQNFSSAFTNDNQFFCGFQSESTGPDQNEISISCKVSGE